ncbi:PREDICTED: uncharacterized protein LOC106813739 isoform X2 [Priapulus caudatus]|uniref:Uncharacterized protein LOC106813739 isoform X1 n=1 Tax=Priapulus caudatus TaxID=37621 RepID=A0ABM1EMM1_PRICU|nr:PREDICTED: uncharacterized protein LOC106813739 isoform X1 [Priapulus caudatus]XP_014673443.1 PREDICTED: uncharacterized protein LOC106813739 isoform X2 [Priapulus caudatus]
MRRLCAAAAEEVRSALYLCHDTVALHESTRKLKEIAEVIKSGAVYGGFFLNSPTKKNDPAQKTNKQKRHQSMPTWIPPLNRWQNTSLRGRHRYRSGAVAEIFRTSYKVNIPIVAPDTGDSKVTIPVGLPVAAPKSDTKTAIPVGQSKSSADNVLLGSRPLWINDRNIGVSLSVKDRSILLENEWLSDMHITDTKLNCLQLMRHRNGKLSMVIQPMRKQRNGNDCGLYAIAVATAVCHGLNPSTLSFKEEMLRADLASCFESLELTPFSVVPSPENSVASVAKHVSVLGYCGCFKVLCVKDDMKSCSALESINVCHACLCCKYIHS